MKSQSMHKATYTFNIIIFQKYLGYFVEGQIYLQKFEQSLICINSILSFQMDSLPSQSQTQYKDNRVNFSPSEVLPKHKNSITPTNTAIPLNPNINIISLLEYELANVRKVPDFNITNLLRKLYPIEECHSNKFISLYRSILKYMTIMFQKFEKSRSYGRIYPQDNDDNYQYMMIVKEIFKYAKFFSEDMADGVKLVLERTDVKNKLLKNKKKKGIPEFQPQPQKTRQEPKDFLSNISLKPSSSHQISFRCHSNRSRYDINSNYRQSLNKINQYGFRQKANCKNLVNQIKNIESSKCIICDRALKNAIGKSQKIFECEQCKRKLHYGCNPRKYNCVFCQLKNMCPLNEVQEQLYVGVLTKYTRRHELFFNCNYDFNKNFLVDIRSLRIKEKFDANASYMVLFPDACTLNINNRLIREILPIHKLSSLKYRQDESIRLGKNWIKKGFNNLTVVERILKRDLREDQRVEPQNHLVGVYITKNSIKPKLFAENCQILSFEESEKLLKDSLLINTDQLDKNGVQEQPEIACETEKISLMCSLTLQKLVYPGRTIFCKHIHCFDILNFLYLNSQSKIPKWQCPICKAPAYEFRIDPIVKAIIKFIKDSAKYQNGEWTEVIISKNMKFKPVDKKGEQGDQLPISHLQIDKKSSRKSNHPLKNINKQNFLDQVDKIYEPIDLSSGDQNANNNDSLANKQETQEKNNLQKNIINNEHFFENILQKVIGNHPMNQSLKDEKCKNIKQNDEKMHLNVQEKSQKQKQKGIEEQNGNLKTINQEIQPEKTKIKDQQEKEQFKKGQSTQKDSIQKLVESKLAQNCSENKNIQTKTNKKQQYGNSSEQKQKYKQFMMPQDCEIVELD